MDIAAGLSAASTAISIVKDLREIDRNVDEAAYKLKLAELVEALADAKIALADAKQTVQRLEAEVDSLKNGDLCPKCKDGQLQLTHTEPHYQYGLNHYGVEIWTYQCDGPGCDFLTNTMNDPGGVLPTHAAKKR